MCVQQETLPSNKKLRISLNVVSNSHGKEEIMKENNIQDEKKTEETGKEMDVSAMSDESYTEMKHNILKKHNLDSSPQFIYSKKQNNSVGFYNNFFSTYIRLSR